ncbi:MAG: hypothetical protein K0Q49_2467 [Haloplasmataceae bacterium]|jgi:hypothetical protein|nr:hypothetical protein [Haloplasmataceae bacterium]
MNLYELGNYKQKIVTLFLNNQDIIDLMLPNKNTKYSIAQQLFGYTDQNGNVIFKGQLFPYYYTDGTNQEARTFIQVETDVPQIDKNGFLKGINLYVYEFTHLSLVKLSDADIIKYKNKGYIGTCRTDILAMAIDNILNKNDTFGIGELKLKNVKIFRPPTNEYYGRVLQYSVNSENTGGDICGN